MDRLDNKSTEENSPRPRPVSWLRRSPFPLRYAAYVLGGLWVIFVFGAAIGIIYWALIWVLPSPVDSELRAFVTVNLDRGVLALEEVTRGAETPQGPFGKRIPPPYEIVASAYMATPAHISPEEAAMHDDIDRIVSWIIECARVKEFSRLPAPIQSTLNPYANPDKELTESFEINHTAMRLAVLTRDISDARITQAEKAKNHHVIEQVVTWITIFLGLATTIIVALSSSELFKENPKTRTWLRIGAIAFPAIGTAAAAVVAFYNPAASFTRASHALLSLQQLQGQINSALWQTEGLDCRQTAGVQGAPIQRAATDSNLSARSTVSEAGATKRMPDQQWQVLKERVDEWEKRYQEILQSAIADKVAALAGPQPTSNPAVDQSTSQPASSQAIRPRLN